MKEMPLVSVIMPAYNSERYIAEAINSILKQTYSNLELIIVNDASSDKTLEIISSFNDSRIILLNNDTNSGVSFSLNKAISVAKGDFVARMDADDYSYPNRIECQVAYLLKHPFCVMCGTYAKVYGSDRKLYHFSRSSFLKSLLLFYSCFIHPTVMFRRTILDEFKYEERFNFCEDYDLWLRISKSHSIANIPKILLSYRVYPQSVSFVKEKVMNTLRLELLTQQLDELMLKPTERELHIHDVFANVYSKRKELDDTYLSDLADWLDKLLQANKRVNKYDITSFSSVLYFRWILSCHFIGSYKSIFSFKLIKHLSPVSIGKTFYLLLEKSYITIFL